MLNFMRLDDTLYVYSEGSQVPRPVNDLTVFHFTQWLHRIRNYKLSHTGLQIFCGFIFVKWDKVGIRHPFIFIVIGVNN